MLKGTGGATRTRRRDGTRSFGTLFGGMSYLSLGSGEPLIFLPGLGSHNEAPVGMERRISAQMVEPFAEHRRVWWINRRPGLAPDVTMADLARDLADALRLKFSGPVDVLGVSTGGSLALQLAVDHPDVVKRLVIVSAAYRLSPRGAGVQRRLAREIQAGRPRRAGAEEMALLGAGRGSQRVLRALGWIIGRAMYGKATPDMIATIHAEDGMNLRNRLHEISAPTLVVAGERDAFYSEELFTETDALIPHSRLILHERKGHFGTSVNRSLVGDVLGFFDAHDAGERRAGGRTGAAQPPITAEG